jgi:hypothetical protein
LAESGHSIFGIADRLENGVTPSLMYNTASRLEKAKVNKYILLLLIAIVLTACSGADDVLENIGDVSVPDQLTGCVARTEDGETCEKAVCVADDESDCKSWVKACEKYGHIADVRNGIDTCERKEVSPDS